MMSRLASGFLTLAVIVGVLHTSAIPAAACSCAPFGDDDEGVRGVMDYYGLVVEGHLADYEDPSEPIRFEPEVVYHGELPDEIILDQPWDGGGGSGYSSLGADCRYILMGQPGDRYVLFLQANPATIGDTVLGGAEGTYRPAGCASFVINELGDGVYLDGSDTYETIKRIPGGGIVVGEPPVEIDTQPGVPTVTAVDAVPISVELPDGQDETGEDLIVDPESDDSDSAWVAISLAIAAGLFVSLALGVAYLRRRSS